MLSAAIKSISMTKQLIMSILITPINQTNVSQAASCFISFVYSFSNQSTAYHDSSTAMVPWQTINCCQVICCSFNSHYMCHSHCDVFSHSAVQQEIDSCVHSRNLIYWVSVDCHVTVRLECLLMPLWVKNSISGEKLLTINFITNFTPLGLALKNVVLECSPHMDL